MHILLTGQGAREHALAWKLSRSPLLTKLYFWPEGPPVNISGEKLDVPASAGFDALADAALSKGIDLTICGPEAPLAAGLADNFHKKGLRVFGPVRAAARLESSKEFAKVIMEKAGIPSAAYTMTHTRSQCLWESVRYLRRDGRVVLKADGLAAGKGVFVCSGEAEVDLAVETLFGSADQDRECPVLVEEYLAGRECSWFVLLGEEEPQELGFAVDFKRAREGDAGPNTGGMGCYTPVPWLPEGASRVVRATILDPLLQTLSKEGLPYTGFLYVGLIWTGQGPRVIEFNVRLGDPEAQVLAVQDRRDWLDMIRTTTGLGRGSGDFPPLEIKQKSVAVVMVAEHYPGKTPEDYPGGALLPEEIFRDDEEPVIFAGSMNKKENGLIPGGGRVLTVVAKQPTFSEARSVVLQKCSRIGKFWSRGRWRSDIAELVAGEE